MIYFDNAATTLQKPHEVSQAVLRALQTAGNAGRGAHAPTLNASRIVYRARQLAAELFHAGDPAGIAFTANATEALNTVIHGLLRPGDHVITSACEHNSLLRPLYLAERGGVELTILPADTRGRICYADFERALKPNTRAVALSHAGNLTGNVLDLRRVSAFTKKHGLLLIADAAQTAGSIPIDMQKLGIDALCFTGHKGLMGPQGTGGICLREGVRLAPLKVGGSGIQSFRKEHPEEMPAALEAGTLNAHGLAGLCAGMEAILRIGAEKIHRRELELSELFYRGICAVPGLTVYGDFSGGCERVAIVSLNIRGEDSAYVADRLWEEDEICVRAGAHCAPLMHEALGTVRQGAVRFSFSFFNTEEEIRIGIDAIRRLAALA